MVPPEMTDVARLAASIKSRVGRAIAEHFAALGAVVAINVFGKLAGIIALAPGKRGGAGEGNRTLVVSLGSFCSTIELHPQTKHLARSCVVFYSTLLQGTAQTRCECHIDEPLVNTSSTNAGDLIG